MKFNSLLKLRLKDNNGYTLLEISFSILILSIILGLCILNFQKIYVSYQLKNYSYQLIGDIRYIQQQSTMNPDIRYEIKFIPYFLGDYGNIYQVYRISNNVKIEKQVNLPKTIDMYFNGEAFNQYDPYSPSIRILRYKSTGEIGTRTGTVILKDKINNKEVGIIVHRIRVRIGDPTEVAN